MVDCPRIGTHRPASWAHANHQAVIEISLDCLVDQRTWPIGLTTRCGVPRARREMLLPRCFGSGLFHCKIKVMQSPVFHTESNRGLIVKPEKIRQRGWIVWISEIFGPITAMGFDKHDPRYHQFQRRLKLQGIVAGVIALLLILGIIIGMIWAFILYAGCAS